MVDYLSRVKRLAVRLKLPLDSSENVTPYHQDKLINKEKVQSSTDDLQKVVMRQKVIASPKNKTDGSTGDDDGDDDVFWAADDDGQQQHTHCQNVRRASPVAKHQLNVPIVNKRLKNIKRPLVSTRSVPVSPVPAIPDEYELKEHKLRDHVDYLCREMVNKPTVKTYVKR